MNPGTTTHMLRSRTSLHARPDVQRPFTTARPRRCPRSFCRPRASDKEKEEPSAADLKQLKQKFFTNPKPTQSPFESQDISIDNVNPYSLGRQARRAFDSLWGQFTKLSNPSKSYIIDDVLEPAFDTFGGPQAQNTTVLVVGATGRVGRIVTRKLLLRGYKVKALVRNRGQGGAEREGIPSAATVVEGDVGEMKDCQAVIKGVDKVIYCAAARTTFTSDLVRVEDKGVMNLVKALQDEHYRSARRTGKQFSRKTKKEIADFSHEYHQAKWNIDFVGVPTKEKLFLPREMSNVNFATAEINFEDHLLFEGTLYTRGAVAEVGADITDKLPRGEHRTADTEGITLRVRGDGNTYGCLLKTVDGQRYMSRFPTRAGFLTVRLPFSSFRAEFPGQPALQPEKIQRMSLRFELRRPTGAAALPATANARRPAPALEAARAALAALRKPGAVKADKEGKAEGAFSLEVDWIKALPGGQEPDFVLVSCAGVLREGLTQEELEKTVSFKRRGEENLRRSGLGYVVIRPGTLVAEPGGYRALLFDQGGRISQSISCADVADICLRALYEPQARNKTFDVCYEYQPEEGLQMYELVATTPSKDSNYLGPALATLAKNT